MYADSCRTCASCESGDEHYCETGFTLSFNSTDRDGRVNYGGYASDYVVDFDYWYPSQRALICADGTVTLWRHHGLYTAKTL
ncbi:MAG: hypothetical protein CM15mP74_16280 [Halieaceae bacterium]|nr:MAG: hypothetical protein CM15mP74_16280 [Halieaceae bacterium]